MSCCYTDNQDPLLEHSVNTLVPVYSLENRRLVPNTRIYSSNHRSLDVDDIKNSISIDGCIQLFTGGSTGYKPTPLDKDIVKVLNNSGDNIPLYVHCPFNIDLSSPDRGQYDSKKLLGYLNSEPNLNKTCVLHMGRYSNECLSSNLNNILNSVRQSPSSYPLLLEVSSKSAVGSSWESIRHVYEGMDYRWASLCIDTQHIFASGMCSFEGPYSFANIVDNVDDLGIQIQMIHLNDSAVDYCSGTDRHAPLGQGYIWGNNLNTLEVLVRYASDAGIKLVGETSDSNSDRMLIDNILSKIK